MGAESESFDISGKILILGDSNVGKTSILVRFKDKTFLTRYFTTCGIDFKNKTVDVDGTAVKLQMWDTAGQERYRSITRAYLRGASALLLLYDVTNMASFQNIRAWLAEIKENAEEDVIIMLLGNKCDLNAERVVPKEDGEKVASNYEITFMETSAKSGMNVDLAFMAIARALKEKKSSTGESSDFDINGYVQQRKQSECCY